MDEIRTFTFEKGSHSSREDGLCVMEAVALLAGEKHSDTPKCADPVITNLAIWLNDSCGDALRQELLLDLPWRIVGTRSTPDIEQQRAYMAADWAVRFVCPILFRRAGFVEEAASLEALAEINCKSAARAAYAAAYAAAGVAAGVEAGVAAGVAARVARVAAGVEAGVAAGVAAYAARAAADVAARAARAARAAYAAHAAAGVAAGAAYAAARAARAAYAAYAAYAAAGVEAGAAADAAARVARVAAGAAADLEVIQKSLAALLDKMIRLTEPQERACGKVVNTARCTSH